MGFRTRLHASTPSGSDTFRYTGKPYDTATSLYYFGARFYDPTVGRFLTRDPIRGTKFDPQSFNAYAYARDNPMGNVDPTGMLGVSIDFQGAVNFLTGWWNQLPGWEQTGLTIAGFIGIGLATGGLGDVVALAEAGDILGAIALAVTGSGIFATDYLGFAGEGSRPSAHDIGVQGELDAQKFLAEQGIQTERGWIAYTATNRVQVDLVDFENGHIFDPKVGPVSLGESDYSVSDIKGQAGAQAALIGRKITLINPSTGDVRVGFKVNAVTWMNLVNSNGEKEFDTTS